MNSETGKGAVIKTGIIVLNWNGCRDTLACLGSLMSMDFGKNLEVAVYVVDNGSEECSPEIFREKYPQVGLIVNKANLGYAGGNNVGIKKALEAGCQYVMLLNNDTIVSPNLADETIKVAESYKTIGIVAPKSISLQDPSVIQYAGGKMDLNKGRTIHVGNKEKDEGQYDYRCETGFCTGSCLLLRSEMLKKTGLLEENYFLYQEDSDLCLKALKCGYRLFYTGNAFILHKGSPCLGGYMNSVSFYYSARNSFYLVKKHGTLANKINFTVYVLFFYWAAVLGYSVVKRQPGLFTHFYRACRDFLCSRQGQLR